MRVSVVLSLSSVLFKSYIRASSRGRISLIYSQPKIMLIIDIVAFGIPFALLQYILSWIPYELMRTLEPTIYEALVSLPLVLTSAVIASGILFELGQSASSLSSEAVNWLPISPREYVAASAISTSAVYSPFLAIGAGVTLSLALRFSLMRVWPLTILLSVLALLLGAFMVEIFRAIMNRVSLTVYRRAGKFTTISRIVLIIFLFVTVQLAFNPIILYHALTVIVSGIELIWFMPMIWPSMAIVSLTRHETLPAIAFSALSAAFAASIFIAASNLRLKYWSPVPISITIKSTADYAPRSGATLAIGFNALEAAIAMKDLRGLIRRKDMARFIAIPVMMVVSFLLPTFLEPGYAARSPDLFASFIPFMVPLMLSMISIGQEGKAIVNLCMLPITVKEFIKGKLLPVWIISLITTVGVFGVFQIFAPIEIDIIFVVILASIFIIVVEGFIGLGIGSRYPDYSIGPRSRYVTFTGFLLGFLIGGTSALLILAPSVLYLILVRGLIQMPTISFRLIVTITTIGIGSALSYVSYRYCKSGIKILLSNLHV